jgi:hypothetical protein
MIGWYFEVVIGFLVRAVIRFAKLRSSEAWPVEKGIISAATCPAAVYGGPVAELGYTYTHKGEYYSGIHLKAFMLRSSAENYVSQIHIGSQIPVRVKPTGPETSVVALDE